MHSSRMHTAHTSSRLLGGVCLSACWDTPQVWAWIPPWVWAWRLPRYGPGDPPTLGLETPWVWAWRPPRCGPGDSTGVGLETPLCGPGDPPRCGPGDPPARPLNFPLGVGLETLPPARPSTSPWVWASRPARHAGIPLPRDLQGML